MIMILTDKTLKDFTFWLYNEHAMKIFNIEFMKPLLLNALIIEWFDSVGIHIEINVNQITDKNKNIPKCNFDSDIFHVKHRTKEGRTLTQLEVNTTRQEATEKAIAQANLIYNEKKA